MLINRLRLRKVLSFNDSIVELGQLNVLIGPNAVGKSNLIEIIGLMQAAPRDLSAAILRGGGVRQWIWLRDSVPSPIATIECELTLPQERQVGPLLYQLEFSEDAGGFVILGERLAKTQTLPRSDWDGTYIVRRANRLEFGQEASNVAGNTPSQILLSRNESFLSQFKNPADPTPITNVGNQLANIRIFREFRTGLQSPLRYGISTSSPHDGLTEGADNLALVLNELDFLGVHGRIREYLQRFCERFEDVKVRVGEGLARTFLREAGLTEMLSAIRMSDGTLKFLALLAALFYPRSPQLVCIEEPEVGLHPDALQLVAEALLEASQSIQVIVTTHSDALVDALTHVPESVLVCERDFNHGTQMKRLSKERLREWLEHYTLGHLWRKGEIGGGRW